MCIMIGSRGKGLGFRGEDYSISWPWGSLFLSTEASSLISFEGIPGARIGVLTYDSGLRV